MPETATGASIEFNNPLLLGTTTDGAVDLSESSTVDYIIVKDSVGSIKDLVTGAAFAIDGNVLNIELADGSFEIGDTIQLTANVRNIYGEALNGDIVYWYSGGSVKELDSANSFWLDPEYPKEIMIDLD